MESLLFAARCINSKKRLKKYFAWLVWLIVRLGSCFPPTGKSEFGNYQDRLFYLQKQSRHPLIGERSIEYPWVMKKIRGIHDCTILDVGTKEGLPTTDLLLKNNLVYGIDPDIDHDIMGNHIKIIKGDIRRTDFDDGFFDAVVIVSTLEHIGISGRYHISEDDQAGDLLAMKEIHRILKPGGIILGSVPYGRGKSLPLNRLYNQKRLDACFEKFSVIGLVYMKYFEEYGFWAEVDQDTADQNNWDQDPWYALALFELQKAL